jgi:hypothetical protein
MESKEAACIQGCIIYSILHIIFNWACAHHVLRCTDTECAQKYIAENEVVNISIFQAYLLRRPFDAGGNNLRAWNLRSGKNGRRRKACWIIVGFWAEVTFSGYRFSILKNLREIWTILSQNYSPVYGRVFVILQGSYGRKQRRTEGKNRGFRRCWRS